MSVLPSNDLRISCRRSWFRPHNPTLPLLGPEEPGARWERRPTPACRLHARVRRLARARVARSGGHPHISGNLSRSPVYGRCRIREARRP
jgi:hypothetical protein